MHDNISSYSTAKPTNINPSNSSSSINLASVRTSKNRLGIKVI